MLEEVIQIMVNQWYLPEDQVRAFMAAELPASANSAAEVAPQTIDDLRNQVADILQNLILESEA